MLSEHYPIGGQGVYMRNMVYLVTIKSLDPIEGKDRIVYAHFEENGYGVICSKDFQIGEKAVYFEVDSILPELPEYESFRARCYRPSLNGFLIKNMKMFKLYSNGLIMHQNEVPLIKEQKTVADLGGIAKRGDLTELTGVKKYEPEDDSSPADSDKRMPAWKRMLKSFLMKHKATRWLGKKLFLAKKASGDFPSYLISKSDEDNIQNFPGRFEKFKDDLCYVTIKMEGQSMTVLNVPDGNKLGKFMVYGRNSCGSPKLWKFAETDGMEQKLKEAFKATKHIYAVQGEHTASDVQDGIYKNGEHFYVYLVKDLTDMKSLSSVEMSEFCDKFGFETVPFITSGEELNSCFKNVDDMQEYVEHQWFKVDGTVNRLDDRYDKLPKGEKFAKPKYHRHEGIVVRNADQSWSFKVKSNNYQIEGR